MSAERDLARRASSLLHAGRILVALGLLAILFVRFVNPSAFLDAIGNFDWRFVLLTFIAYLLWRIFSTWQMAYLLTSRGLMVPFWRVFRVQAVAILFSTALPSDFAGAAATWYMLSKDTGRRIIIANALIYLRVLNLVVVALFTCIGLVMDPGLASLHDSQFVAVFAAVVFLALLPMLFPAGMRLVEHVCRKFLTIIPGASRTTRMREALARLFEEAQSLRQLSLSGYLILWSLALSLNLAAAVFVCFAMRAAAIYLPFTVSVWLVGLIAVVQMFPLTPGSLGVREVSIVAALTTAYHVAPARALAFATMILLVNLILGASLGAYWLTFPVAGRSR